VIGRFTKWEYPKTADHQNQETKTYQEHLKNQNPSTFPKALSRRFAQWSEEQTEYRVSVHLALNRQKPSELSA
jgi:hypothetical protein